MFREDINVLCVCRFWMYETSVSLTEKCGFKLHCKIMIAYCAFLYIIIIVPILVCSLMDSYQIAPIQRWFFIVIEGLKTMFYQRCLKELGTFSQRFEYTYTRGRIIIVYYQYRKKLRPFLLFLKAYLGSEWERNWIRSWRF
jgi:hypothetical protein